MSWATTALGEVAKIERNSIAPTEIAAGSRYVGLEHIESGGASISFGEVANGELASSKFRFGPKHILFGKLRPYLAKIVCPDFEGICSTDILPIAPGKRTDQRYLLHFLRRPETVAWASGRATGVNLPRLSPSELASLEVPLPPLDEQRRIAAILDKADALRRKRKRALELLDGLMQSIFLEMFGDPSKNPKNWPRINLGDCIHKASDGPHVSPQYSPVGVPFLSTRHIKPGQIVWEDLKYIDLEQAKIHWKKCKPEQGDILYTKGGTTGLAALVDGNEPFAVWVHVALLKTNKHMVDPAWLESMLNSEFCYRQSQLYTHGIANRDLGLKRMVKIDLYLPPRHEQERFASASRKLRTLRAKFARAGAEDEKLFSSLQHRAFTGQL